MTQNTIRDPELFEEKLAEFCDIVSQDPALERASRRIGYSPKWIWAALKRSGAGDPRYLLRWPDREGEERIQFGDAVTLARRLHKIKLDHTIRAAVDVGIPVVQTFQGEIIWEKDGALLTEWGGDTPEAKEAAERLGDCVDYPFKHRLNVEGKLERIPLEVYQPAPGALRQHVARSLLPSEYNPPEVRQVSTEHSGAVLILNASKPAYAKDFVPNSPIRQDLHERLAALRAKGPEHKHATDKNGFKTVPKISNGSTSNDPPERTGHGAVPQVDADGHVVGAKRIPMIDSRGRPAPGGFSGLTGKPT
jgi:hypothetical protein